MALGIAAAGFFQFAQQFLLALGEIDRGFDDHMTQQIAVGVAAYPFDALAAQTEDLPGLGFLGNPQFCRAVQGRDFDFAAEGRRREADSTANALGCGPPAG